MIVETWALESACVITSGSSCGTTPHCSHHGDLSRRLHPDQCDTIPLGSRLALALAAVGVLFQFFSIYVMEPLIIRLTGKPIDLNEIALIEGNLFMLALFLALVWTLAAFGEELVFRGYLMNRVAELLGGNSTAWVLSLLVVSVLFGV